MHLLFRTAFAALALLVTLSPKANAEVWTFAPDANKDIRYLIQYKENTVLFHLPYTQQWVLAVTSPRITSAQNTRLIMTPDSGEAKIFTPAPNSVILENASQTTLAQFEVSRSALEMFYKSSRLTLEIDGHSFAIPTTGLSNAINTLLQDFRGNFTADYHSSTPEIRTKARALQAILQCDKFATHTWDYNRKAWGVQWKDLDGPKAVAACEQAIALNGRTARLLFQLGRAYEKVGNSAAFTVLDEAAWDNEYPAAFYNLGLLHENGLYTPKDAYLARRTYIEGASYNHPPSEYALGRIDHRDAKTLAEINAALAHLNNAHIAGYALATEKLGFLVYDGEIANKSRADAVPLLKAASKAGRKNASYRLARMYKTGDGVAANGLDANFYLLRASSQGHKQARKDLNNE